MTGLFPPCEEWNRNFSVGAGLYSHFLSLFMSLGKEPSLDGRLLTNEFALMIRRYFPKLMHAPIRTSLVLRGIFFACSLNRSCPFSAD